MAKQLYKLVKPLPSPEATMRSIAGSIRKELEPVGRQHVSQRNAVVSDFDHKPKFESQVKVGQKGIELKILLTNERESIGGRATIGDLVRWLFETGVRPHIIRAKAGKFLVFQWGGKGSYSRKVGIGGGRGSGQVSNPQTFFAKQVRHPGFQPSRAFENINKQLLGAAKQAIDRGFRNGFNRAKKSK